MSEDRPNEAEAAARARPDEPPSGSAEAPGGSDVPGAASPPGSPPGAGRRPGKRASGARPERRDRWAHRRAEPRMLAFAWTMYLLLATGLSFARIGVIEPVDVQVYRASARALLLSVAIGACALWPMVRLSQDLPRRPLQATFKDLLVILAPMQAVIWGQALLSGWPVRSLGAAALALGAWTAICGGALAMATASGSIGGVSPGRRLGAMVAILALTAAGGAVVMSQGLGPRTGLLTPYTTPWALLGRDLSLGYTLGPTSAQWGAVIGLCLAAGAPWLVAAAMGGRRSRAPGAAGSNNGPLAESAPKR